jgi:hypothetical protein
MIGSTTAKTAVPSRTASRLANIRQSEMTPQKTAFGKSKERGKWFMRAANYQSVTVSPRRPNLHDVPSGLLPVLKK